MARSFGRELRAGLNMAVSFPLKRNHRERIDFLIVLYPAMETTACIFMTALFLYPAN
jgi:hypothetical protein